MSDMNLCQSCAMPLNDESQWGTEADGSKTKEYCQYCYQDGKFTQECTMEEMIEICVPHVSGGQPYKNEEEAREEMKNFFPSLKRWSA